MAHYAVHSSVWQQQIDICVSTLLHFVSVQLCDNVREAVYSPYAYTLNEWVAAWQIISTWQEHSPLPSLRLGLRECFCWSAMS